jgi:hypothetical protein
MGRWRWRWNLCVAHLLAAATSATTLQWLTLNGETDQLKAKNQNGGKANWQK